MKALRKDSTIYTGQIIAAIADCCNGSAEQSNAELMELYTLIGQLICEQGEKAYVVHLTQTLAERLPHARGFSPRNLRRMRDFYRTYESSPTLMKKAQSLGWTQNSVILECCETNEQRDFYICLAAEENLSKLALLKAIDSGAFEAARNEGTPVRNVAAACGPVSDCTEEEAVDTNSSDEATCGAVVAVCEPPRQGSSAPDQINADAAFPAGDVFGKAVKDRNMRHIKMGQKKSLPTILHKPLELLSNRLKIDSASCQRPPRRRHRTISESPPDRWRWNPQDQPRCCSLA